MSVLLFWATNTQAVILSPYFRAKNPCSLLFPKRPRELLRSFAPMKGLGAQSLP